MSNFDYFQIMYLFYRPVHNPFVSAYMAAMDTFQPMPF